MTNKPKYTFLLPAYKARYFDEALRSIQRQTYRDFLVLISDDCSPEDLRSIAEPYLQDPRFAYRRNERNIGGRDLVKHWNLLLSLAKEEYVIIASDDDVYEPHFLEKIDALTAKYPFADIIRSRIREINVQGEPIWEDTIYMEFQCELEAVCSYPTVCMGNNVFKRSALNSAGGFVAFPYGMGSDNATVMMMSKNGMANTHEILFNFRISDIQISNTSKKKDVNEWKLKAALDFHTWMNDYIATINYEHTLLNETKMHDFINNHIRRGFVHCSRLYFGSLGIKEFISLYKRLNAMQCFERFANKALFVCDYIQSRKRY